MVFPFREEVEQEGPEASLAEGLRDEVVAWALPTGAAPVSEHDQTGRVRRYIESALEFYVIDGN
jgi:hypothetical protein